MSTSLRVVVTGVGGPAGRSLALELVARGHQVLGVDVRTVLVPGVATLEVPPATSPAFLPALRAVAARFSADVVVPTVSEELPVLATAQAGPDLISAAAVVIGSADAVRAADDKWLTWCALEAADVPVPRTVRPSRLRGAADLRTALGGAAMISKPRRGRGGRGVVVLAAGTDLGAVDPALLGDDRLVQELATGTEYVVDLLVPPAGALRPAVAIVLEKLALAGGLVGNALAVRRVDGSGVRDIAAAALAAVHAVGLTGPADVDVRRLADGRPVVLEINARFGAHSAAAPEVLDALLDQLGRREEQVA